jgi:hypothetical protein
LTVEQIKTELLAQGVNLRPLELAAGA